MNASSGRCNIHPTRRQLLADPYIELCSFEKLKQEQHVHRLLFLAKNTEFPLLSGFTWNISEALFVPCRQAVHYELTVDCEILSINFSDNYLLKDGSFSFGVSGNALGRLPINEPLRRYAEHLLLYLKSELNHQELAVNKIKELFMILTTFYSPVELAGLFQVYSCDADTIEC